MSTRSASLPSVGLLLALIQLFFTLTWTVYAIYLPKLAAQVGISAGAVILILMLDQAIFTLSDFATGIAADKVSRTIGRIGRIVVSVTVVSCLAFVALPLVAGDNPVSLAAFLALTVIWTVTSSALRAPPLMLLGKYAAKPAIPLLSSLAMLGYGIAGAAAPYLAITLREVDPRWPFIIASVAVLLATLSLSHVERTLVGQAAQAGPPPQSAQPKNDVAPLVFAIGMVVLALGYQLHFAVNTAPLFRKFSDSIDLFMPVFWIGFNIAMFPATLLVKRWGGFAVMGLFGVIGALAIAAAATATALNMLVAAQLAAGASWGCILMSAFCAAFDAAKRDTAGRWVGILFSALAFATFTRMAAIATGLQRDPSWTGWLQWGPTICWLIAGLLLLYVGFVRMRRWMADAAPV
ncbi:MAG: MFS transporter [Pseudorhodoplanes sp.]|jgi:MFS family permease|nr:MFS transporter [Pseudorhodoplanes sp.]